MLFVTFSVFTFPNTYARGISVARLEDILVIHSIGGCSETQKELGFKVLNYLFIAFGFGVMESTMM